MTLMVDCTGILVYFDDLVARAVAHLKVNATTFGGTCQLRDTSGDVGTCDFI